jgi:hypothetical protein
LPGLGGERHEHGRNSRGRRHRLAARERQRDVGAGEVGEAPRREEVAPDPLHRPEHGGVADAAGAQRQHERGGVDRLARGLAVIERRRELHGRP